MAQNLNTVSVKPKRARGERRQALSSAAARIPQQYFAPERRWLVERGPQIAAATAMARQALSLVNSEKNFYDVSGNLNPTISGAPQLLTGMPAGDDSQMRSGRKVRAKELAIKVHFYSATAATTSQTVRVLVIKDNDPRGTAPALSSIMQAVSVDGMPILDQNQGRFKWLYDEVFVLGPLAGGQDAKVLNIDLAMDHEIEYVSTAAGVGSASKGAIFLYSLTDLTATNSSTGSYYSRLRYRDN